MKLKNLSLLLNELKFLDNSAYFLKNNLIDITQPIDFKIIAVCYIVSINSWFLVLKAQQSLPFMCKE
jgi:hypothetical protein